MQIHVHRYEIPTAEERAAVQRSDGKPVGYPSDTWQGWVEPDDLSWILFVGVDGKVLMYDHRDATGAVVTDE